jgi:hypothetical protein
MKYRTILLRVGLLSTLLLLLMPWRVFALAAPDLSAPTGLSILELKVTGSEFVVLQNNTGADITDLSSYALYYFNNYNPFAADVSSSTAFLPTAPLASGQSLLLSGDPRATCGATVAGDLPISLGDSSGFLEIVKLSNENGTVTQEAGDVVSWSSTANGIIQNVPSSTKDGAAMWYRYQNNTANVPNGTFGWQYADVDVTDPCQLNAVIASGPTKTIVPEDSTLVNSGDEVPGTIVSLASVTSVAPSGTARATMPAADIGLKSPKLSELLPDVASPGNDSTDEFIELYNPNDKAFDLAGFTLQNGSTTSETRHNYVFPAGASIPAKGFKAFYSAQTGLSLSNTGGQAWLLDPFGTSIAQSEPYSKPKGGNTWATVNGKWYYTTTPTPNAANSIKAPAASATAKTAASKAKTSKGTAVSALKSANGVAGANSAAAYEAPTKAVPVHPAVLAVVAILALLYGAYEYRHDLANKLYQFRSNRKARA